ncbi:MAG: M16 family metallopeptidase, partial [Gammaproteobacteria bacterium]
EFQKEVQVVMEERRLRTEDEPQALTYEQFMATAYTSSPYRHPIIGWMDDLENMEADDLKKWYRLWYAPNNATVVVVGDVNADEVLKLAKKYFGKLKPSNLTPPKPQREPAQRGQKRITVKAPAELPYLLMGYKVPVINTTEEAWEPYALEVLAGVLDGGDSARFAKDLVRDKRIASSVSAGYSMTSRNSEVFLFDGTPTQDHTINQLEEAIKAQIKQLKEETVSDDELARIKAQVVASNVYELDSVFYQAMQIGMLETVGLDWRLLDQYVDRIKAVTAEQIKAVANKYLIDDHLTVAVLDPQPIDPKNMHRPMRRGGSHGH